MTNFYVVDSIMGSGKTSVMLRILSMPDDTTSHYVIVVPTLGEVDRWKEKLNQPWLPTPVVLEYREDQTKTDDFKKLLRWHARRIIITHAMFDRIDDEIISLFKEGSYCLIIDEVPTPVTSIKLFPGDLRSLLSSNTLFVNPETMNVTWNPEYERERTSHDDLRKLCATGKVFYDKNSNSLFKVSPYDSYFACSKVYILTYMFEAQIVYYYFKQLGIEYKKLSVAQDEEDGEYYLLDYSKTLDRILDLKSLLHICQNERINAVGKSRTAFSLNWFTKQSDKIPTVKKNISNFCRHIGHAKCDDVLWTTFLSVREKVETRGYKKGFLAVNAKATNDYSDKTTVVYLANRFLSPAMLHYFNVDDKKVKVDEDAFALSEMLQFIWRSAIRTGQPINLYVPSSRMRGLLVKWIEENSVQHAV